MTRKISLLLFGLIGLLGLISCSNEIKNKRLPSAENSKIDKHYYEELKEEAQRRGHHLEIPSGLTENEQFKMWHLTEGSDIYPGLWLVNLKSFLSEKKGSYFFDDLDKKYGVIKSPYAKEMNSPYSWIGLTAVWDGEEAQKQDLIFHPEKEIAFKEIPKVKFLKHNSRPSIVMVGANCAFCHTGAVYESRESSDLKIIDAAPATIDMKGFFYDIIGSTYQTMFNESHLIEFYERINVVDAKTKASRFITDLKKELGVKDTILTEAIVLLSKTPGLKNKVTNMINSQAAVVLYEKRETMTKFLVRMLQETYDLKEVTPLMRKRMEYLSWFGAPSPDILTTPEGFGRTDAFGRISNATVRKKSPQHLTAPVSLPPMYGMKFKAFFHYNGNTNSLVSRNVGQAFGLGAIVLDDLGDNKLSSTVNIPNLVELERLIHKVPVPEYVQYFPLQKIDKEKMLQGCNIYLSKCAQCHEANEERVGPEQKLIDHKLVDLEVIDTDREYIKNISREALGLPYKKAIFNFTDAAKDGFYFENNISREMAKDYAQENARGPEFFRDTFLGENRFEKNSLSFYGNNPKGKAFLARHLSGVWATAPYLHNGSVPNLYELLLPVNKRSKKFVVGNLFYDHKKLGFLSDLATHPRLQERVKWKGNKHNPCYDIDDPYCYDTSLLGNSNVGHAPNMYGGELKEKDKWALIEFIKVLKPELEYSWINSPLYRIENNRCQIN